MIGQQLGIQPSEFWRLTFWELGARLAGHLDAHLEDKPDTSKAAFVAALRAGAL